MASVSCKNCGAEMEVAVKTKHSQALGFFLLILGVLSTLLMMLPIGILLIGIGIYTCNAKESIWLCNSCKTAIPRVEVSD